MVHCSKCGTLNPDTAINCSNCGTPLFAPDNRPFSRYERRRYYRENYGYSRGGGGGIGLLLIGFFIIIVGLTAFAGFTAFWNYFWPVVIVLVGMWILAIALRRNRRYNQTSKNVIQSHAQNFTRQLQVLTVRYTKELY